MRPHRKRRFRPGPVTGAVALAALVAGALPATSVASTATPAASSDAGHLARGAITSLNASGNNYFIGKNASVPLKAKVKGEVKKVEYFADDTLLATDSTAPFDGAWKKVPAGQYSITAKVFDKSGKTSTTEPAQVTVLSKPTILASPITRQVRQGSRTSFGVSLATKPSSDVTVKVDRADGASHLSADRKTLTFTPENWNKAQQVPVASAGKNGRLAHATFRASAEGYKPGLAKVQELKAAASDYEQAFLDQYNKIKDPANGYFRNFGGVLVPYHSVETLMVEAPDQGHETTSEAFSYYLWLEAEYGKITEDWGPLNDAWKSIETYAIPPHDQQPTNDGYNPSSPATYAAEYPDMSSYPSQLEADVPVGQDPIAAELKSAYGSSDVYGMHWLMDVDNVYGYGNCGDGSTAPAYINSYQRGSSESVWETITQPSCDTFKFGGPNGYLDLFTGDASYAQQWKFTDAPDADARAVQVVYQAKQVAADQGKSADVSDVVAKATKMGDYLRYAMFDKYFKKIGDCTDPTSCPGGSGKDSSHYLISWYYAWGGSKDTQNGWAWRIGDGAAHQGYQDPLTAYALSSDADMKPKSATGAEDWGKSLDRQLEFLQWLQSSDGAIAGGATNSWDGQYGPPPAGQATFHGMFYDEQPVWHDPPSNRWFGFQTWGMERVAEYYDATGDARAKSILDKWVDWALANTTVGTGGDFSIPDSLEWSGQPDDWNADDPGANSGLSVDVASTGTDVGVAASLAKTLLYYAHGSGDTEAQTVAEGLLDAMLAHTDDLGIAVPETRTDYNRFDDPYDSGSGQGVYVPEGWTGTMPNGDAIDSDSTFLSIRSFYQDDPDWPKVQDYLDGGAAPTFTYHRFWSQTEIATAFATHVDLFS